MEFLKGASSYLVRPLAYARGSVSGPNRDREGADLHPAWRRKAAALVVGLCLAGGCARFSPSTPNGPLTTVEQVRQLTPEAAGAQVPVHLHGTVTYVDGLVQLLFVQDATGAVLVEGLPPGLQERNSVDVQGTVVSGGSSPDVTAESIRVGHGRSPLPAPARPSAQDLASGRFQYRYVEIEGVVRSAVTDHGGRFSLVLHALGWDINVTVRDQAAFDYHSLVDAVVRARGDVVTSLDARGVPIGVKLWLGAINDVEVVKPAPAAADVPVRTVRSVLSTDRTRQSDHRIRLHGSVALEGGGLACEPSEAGGAVFSSTDQVNNRLFWISSKYSHELRI